MSTPNILRTLDLATPEEVQEGIQRFYPWPAFQSIRPVDPVKIEEKSE